VKCLILAGGFATRLFPLTINRAKALLEYKGKPVITQIVNKIPQNIGILVSTNRKFVADFEDWRDSLDRPVEILVEEAVTNGQKHGAVGAIDFWIKNKNIQEDLMVIAGDNYFEFELTDFMAEFNGLNTTIAVYDFGTIERVCELGQPCQLGLVSLINNKIIRFDEKPAQPASSLAATGMYLLPQRIFPTLSRYCRESKRDNLGNFASYLLHEDEVYAYVFSDIWTDIGDEMMRIPVAA
jgi:glucose-1-phosphate thymidylyltransferase